MNETLEHDAVTGKGNHVVCTTPVDFTNETRVRCSRCHLQRIALLCTFSDVVKISLSITSIPLGLGRIVLEDQMGSGVVSESFHQ